jgi:DMSO reductase anchor subunit
MEQESNRPAYVFLVLAPAAVGCLLGSLILDGSYNVRPFYIGAVTIALVFALAAALAPIFRLRRPFRAYRLLRDGRSPLSSQAISFGLFFLVLVVYWALILAGQPVLSLGIIAVALGFVTMGFVAQTYLLVSRPGWRHWSTPASLLGTLLSLGLATSLTIALHWSGLLLGDRAAASTTKALVLVGIALLALSANFRIEYLGKATAGTRAVAAQLRGKHYSTFLLCMLLEVAIAGIATAVSYAADWPIAIAWVALLIGLFVEKWIFFFSAAPRTFRDEVSSFSQA